MVIGSRPRVAAWICGLVWAVAAAHAQIGRVNGMISGQITDANGAPVASARVLLSGPGGFSRSTTAESEGRFAFFDLATGSYVVQVTAPAYAGWSQSGIVVAVGRNVQLAVVLRPEGSRQKVTVHAQQSGLDASQTSSVTNIDKDRIEELPIESRNYLAFTLLAPQVAPGNPAIMQQTLAPAVSAFSFGGLRPGSNAVYIDGVDDNDEYTGASRTELSPEAISDFQIVNHGFAAESGGAAGGSIDVQTRMGMPLQHGDAFIFVQNGALNANPPLERLPRKPDESRLRAGISTGGAFGKKTFYYIAGEQEYARGEDANNLAPATITTINQALQRVGPLPSLLLQGGFIPTTEQETEFSARGDRTLTPRQSLMLRYALTNNRNVNEAFNTDDLSDRSARGSSFFDDNSLNGTLASTISAATLNRLSFEVSQRRVVDRSSFKDGPGVVLSGIAQFGTPYTGNDRRYETHVDLEESFLRQVGRHLVQAGGGLERVQLRAANRDGFQGLYVFQNLAALTNGAPDFYVQSFGDPNTNFSEIRSAAYVEDHWTASRQVTVDYGLRYEDNYLPAPLPQHPLNVSPRLGIAYAPGHSWVVRSGFGIFYDRYLLASVNRILEFNGTRAQQQIAQYGAAASFYQSGVSFTQPHSGIAPSVWQAAPQLANPYSEVASLSVERTLPQGFTAKAEFQFVHGVRLGRTANVNLAPPVTLTPQNAPALGVPSPTAQQLERPVFSPARLQPAYDAVNQFQTTASSNYNGATFTLNRQFDEQFELMAGYTFSKTIDDASYDAEQPQNPYAPGQERALSLEDQRQRLTVSGLWVLGPDLDDPQDQAAGPSTNPVMRALTGLEIAPIVSAYAGFRANPLTGQDSNLEHIYPFAARPLGYTRNALQTAPNGDFDLRLLKMVPIWRGHLDVVAESFNLLNHTNVSLVNPVFGTGSQPVPAFRVPIAASTARRVQFSLDYEY
jgi:hypothetical protein